MTANRALEIFRSKANFRDAVFSADEYALIESALAPGEIEGLDILEGAEIIDGGDGVPGHFCIGRQHKDGYWEFYNNGRWRSAGQVFKAARQGRGG